MTKEEAKKAYKEGTWLVWNSDRTRGYEPQLCRVQEVLDHYTSGPLFQIDIGATTLMCTVNQLRIATPNDMLKYGP